MNKRGEMVENSIIERLHEWSLGRSPGPQRVLLYPTNLCNLRCVFCYQQLKPYDYSDSMPKEKWLELTEELCEMGVEILQISGGGEPMIVAGTVLGMMEIIKKHGRTGRLVNNGTLWNEDMIRRVMEMGWDNVIFSVDGSNEKTHERLRGVKGSFRKTTEAIAGFSDWKKRLKSERPLLEFSHVLTKWNYRETPDMVKLAHTLGVDVITYEPVFVSNPFVHEIKLSRQEREEYIRTVIPEAKRVAENYRIHTNLNCLMELECIEETGKLKRRIMERAEKVREKETSEKNNPFLDLPCYEPWLWPKIEADGRIGPCSSNMLEKENIKNKTFRDVWLGRPFNDFRRRIMERHLPEGCENCVSTHLPLNKEIREKLGGHIKNGRPD